jgi:hypothetical protein
LSISISFKSTTECYAKWRSCHSKTAEEFYFKVYWDGYARHANSDWCISNWIEESSNILVYVRINLQQILFWSSFFCLCSMKIFVSWEWLDSKLTDEKWLLIEHRILIIDWVTLDICASIVFICSQMIQISKIWFSFWN